MDRGQIILFQTQGGEPKIEVRLSNETVWLTVDQMSELFQRDRSTIQRHIKRIYNEGELTADSTCAFFAQVQTEGKRQVERKIPIYNLDMIISVGYRVNSHRGVQFRQWATQVLKEYMIKGFVLNDDLLKNAGQGNYFDELLARIRDIRSSEKVFYRKVLEIYALSIDYDPRTAITQQFFKTVQNKMHFAAHGPVARNHNRLDCKSCNAKLQNLFQSPISQTVKNAWVRDAGVMGSNPISLSSLLVLLLALISAINRVYCRN